MQRNRLWLGLIGLAIFGGQSAEAQLFPNMWIRRQRPDPSSESPIYKMNRDQFYGLHPTEWRRFPTGWGLTNPEAINRDLAYVDCWDNVLRKIKISRLLEVRDCPCCKQRNFEWLEGNQGVQTTSLCGRNAVQVVPATPAQLDLASLATTIRGQTEVHLTRFLLRFSADDCEFTVFPDGRAIIKGTPEEDRALALYARYIGH